MVIVVSALFSVLYFGYSSNASENRDLEKLSPETESCIGCHATVTPGIVKDWLTSRHARTAPDEALKNPLLQRRISAESIPDGLKKFTIGCYECHSLNREAHNDNFEYFGFRINVIVSPNDCKTCHSVEVSQYSGSKKAHAIKNLMENPVYRTLVDSIDGVVRIERGRLIQDKPSDKTLHETCLGCHGTKVEVKDMKIVSTKISYTAMPIQNQGTRRL